jgi:kanamycin kinase
MAPPDALPLQVVAAHMGWTIAVAWEGVFGKTWRLASSDGEIRFAKVRPRGGHPSLADERDRLIWTRTWITVPDVVEYAAHDDTEWLVTSGLDGEDATVVKQSMEPETLVPLLGAGLRTWHETLPVGACPFDFRLDAAIEHCERRIYAKAEAWDDLHQVHKHMTPEGALRRLKELRPADEDLVVCHGDYCFPNVFIAEETIAGYLDVGELGVADRWWDIAIGGWSTTWNVDPRWEPLFYEGYGVEPDPDRIAFYRLLYDLAS